MSASNHRVAGLLTGASLVTLSFLTGRGTAVAAGTTLTGSGNKTISTNFDFVNIENPANYSLVTNNATISDGHTNPLASAHQAIGVDITAAATVGQFVNNGAIRGIEGTNAANGAPEPTATATGMLVNGVVPLVTNNGQIQGLAIAHATGVNATAYAAGIREASRGLTTAAFALVNNNHILATAQAFASGGGASAYAVGVSQYATDATVFNALVTNSSSGTISGLARATAIGTDVSAGASAVGATQYARSVTVANMTVVNSGQIKAQALAAATALGTDHEAEASANAVGVNQRARRRGVSERLGHE